MKPQKAVSVKNTPQIYMNLFKIGKPKTETNQEIYFKYCLICFKSYIIFNAKLLLNRKTRKYVCKPEI
jgi:hypothetical protein